MKRLNPVILVLFLSILFYSCSKNKKNNAILYSDLNTNNSLSSLIHKIKIEKGINKYNIDVHDIKIEDCDYLLIFMNKNIGITHKGTCKNH